MLRRLGIVLCVIVFFIIPVSAQTIYNESSTTQVLELPAEETEVQTELKNDNVQPIAVYLSASEADQAEIRVYLRQNGENTLLLEGAATALSKCRVQVCVLKAQESAVLYLQRSGSSGGPLTLTLEAQPLGNEGGTDYVRLLVYICVWMSLAILGAYIVIIVSNRQAKRK